MYAKDVDDMVSASVGIAMFIGFMLVMTAFPAAKAAMDGLIEGLIVMFGPIVLVVLAIRFNDKRKAHN